MTDIILSFYTSPSRFLSVSTTKFFHVSDESFVAFLVLVVVSDYDPCQFVIGSSQVFLSFIGFSQLVL